MDRSVLRSPDPAAIAPSVERRRSVRQKLHSPVYASFNGPETGMVVDLSELLDLNEDGFAVQASERLEMNRAVTLCLDLPETKNYIHGSGQVIWSDEAGRGGVRFSALPESSRRILKEWLFANLLIGCSNHAARSEQLARREVEQSPEAATDVDREASNVVAISEQSETLSRAETEFTPPQMRPAASLQLEAARREVREMGDDFDAILHLIVERALGLTEASGAALAFLTGGTTICRARAGEPAPARGTPVDVSQGLSGECVRSGQLVWCVDAENDVRVDPEVCRALGIGSLMAAPIVSDFRVVGLLEVFSPHPRAFTRGHATILERLVEIIPIARREYTPPDSTPTESALAEDSEEDFQSETPIKTEAMLGASWVPVLEADSIKLSSVELSSADLSATDLSSTHANREVLREGKAGAGERVTPPVIEPAVAAQVPAQIPLRILKPAPKARVHWYQRALFWLSAAVVSLALGYLTGPLVDGHWGNSLQVGQRSLFQIVNTKTAKAKATDEAAAVSGQRAAEPSWAEQRLKSLPELRALADRGDADAQWQMGVRYHNGEGVAQDDAQAMQWFLRAAEQGNVAAQSALGSYYWAGRGVSEDLSKAYMWSAIALAGGDEISKSRLEGLASRMTRAQVSAARQQAEEWIHQHNSAKTAKN